MSYLDKLKPLTQAQAGTPAMASAAGAPATTGYKSKLQPIEAGPPTEEQDGFFKSLVKAPITMVARPFQAVAALGGVSDEAIDKFSKEKLGGFVAPTPDNFSDVKKDIGRGIETVAFGLGPVSGGAAIGLGSSLESGEDLFSVQTAFQTVLGAGAGKILGLVGKPIADATGKVIGKITPQYLKNVASSGTKAMSDFAKQHNILPEVTSKALSTGVEKLEMAANKPFDLAGNLAKKPFVATPKSIVDKNYRDLTEIDDTYVNMRKAQKFSKDSNLGTRKRIANTDVMVGSVDENGLIRTQQPGGAVERYQKMTIDGVEDTIEKNLIRLDERVSIDTIKKELTDSVNSSGLEGADLKAALNSIKRELAGYRLKADANDFVPLVLAQRAKISTTKGINFQTPPEVKTYRKAIARGLKKTIEKNSKIEVKVGGKIYKVEDINKELSKYYNDIEFLQRLDGKRVKGGKVGKYFAQISGNIVGGVAGAAVGGPFGSAIGTIVGGELGGKIKGKMLSRTLAGRTGFKPPKNKILEAARKLSNKPYSKSLGNLNAKYSNTAAPNKTSISKIIPPKAPGVNTEVGVTSFRGKPVKSIAETKAYYETPRAKGFENNLSKTSADFGVKVNGIDKVAGSWEGSIEPSFMVKVEGSMGDKIAYAVKNAKAANQDAVILFTKGNGNGVKYEFNNVKNPDQALKVLHKNGISGATIRDKDIVVYDMDNSLAKKLKTFTSLTGNKPIKTNGKIRLIEKKDYGKHIVDLGRGGGNGSGVRAGQTGGKIEEKLTKISQYTDKGKEGKFWTTPEGATEDFGPIRKDAFVDKSKLYKGQSSEEFLKSRNLWKKFDPKLKKELGFDTLEDASESYLGGEKSLSTGKKLTPTRRFEGNPNEYFKATQERAEDILKREGYPGAWWTSEDDLNPTQYHIWDKSVIKKLPAKPAKLK